MGRSPKIAIQESMACWFCIRTCPFEYRRSHSGKACCEKTNGLLPRISSRYDASLKAVVILAEKTAQIKAKTEDPWQDPSPGTRRFAYNRHFRRFELGET